MLEVHINASWLSEETVCAHLSVCLSVRLFDRASTVHWSRLGRDSLSCRNTKHRLYISVVLLKIRQRCVATMKRRRAFFFCYCGALLFAPPSSSGLEEAL